MTLVFGCKRIIGYFLTSCVVSILLNAEQNCEHHGPAHYEYHYDVHDEHTGDVHGQHEARKDDHTHGEYYLIDADGHKRTVKYHVEGKSGFIAEVHREPVKGFHDAPAHHNFHHKFEEKY
uniref:Uncharacterized protein n=1 Tax=Anopheles atroparvus TaxID=41427 RepID=A0AAG5DXR2_ANOAO